MEQDRIAVDEHTTLELRLLPELRRSAVWAGLGLVLCAIALHVLESVGTDRPNPLHGLPKILGWSSVGAWLFVQWVKHVRVKIDAHGVYRRILVHWQHWPWALFESGTVSLGQRQGAFVFTNQPWYRRYLSFCGYFDEEKAKLASEICLSHWARPEREALPPEAKIRYMLFTLVRLTADGICIGRLGNVRMHRWDEVDKVVMHRATADHEDFSLLDFEIGRRRFSLVCRGDNKNYIGAHPKKIAALFEARVPSDRLLIYTDDPPRSLEEAEEQLTRFRHNAGNQFIRFLIAGIIMGLVVAYKVVTTWWKGKLEFDVSTLVILGVMATAAALWLCIPVVVRSEDRQRELEFVRRRDELAATSPDPPDPTVDATSSSR